MFNCKSDFEGYDDVCVRFKSKCRWYSVGEQHLKRFMSKGWKAAIRNKRKCAIQFPKDRTPENFELKKRYRITCIATRERRKALIL